VICCGEEHERRNRDVASHEGQRLCCGGGHSKIAHSVWPEMELGEAEEVTSWVEMARGVVIWCCCGSAMVIEACRNEVDEMPTPEAPTALATRT
jgi:hypothetical protein